MDFHWHEVISFGRLVEKEPVVLAVELSVGTGSVGRAPLTHTLSCGSGCLAQWAFLSEARGAAPRGDRHPLNSEQGGWALKPGELLARQMEGARPACVRVSGSEPA